MNTIIVDNGSGVVKAGICGDLLPSHIFPSIVGVPKYESHSIYGNKKNIYVGDEIHDKKGILKLTYPIEHGIITNWDYMEKIWDYTFDTKMKINTKESNILLTEAPHNPKKNREKIIEVMFEKYSFPASYIAIQGVLSLYSSGRTSGIVVDIGDGVSHTVPIYEGYHVSHAVNRYDIAGRDITNYLQRLLIENGVSLNTSSEKEIVRDIKEKLSYYADDVQKEEKLYQTKNMSRKYTLPDGGVISLGTEMFKCCEILFDPSLIGKEHHGIDHVICDSIKKCDINIRREMYSNIVLSGGTTMTKNFSNRLTKNVLHNGKVVASPDRKYSVWTGGSILGSFSAFNDMLITKKEYDEFGDSIVHKKCM